MAPARLIRPRSRSGPNPDVSLCRQGPTPESPRSRVHLHGIGVQASRGLHCGLVGSSLQRVRSGKSIQQFPQRDPEDTREDGQFVRAGAPLTVLRVTHARAAGCDAVLREAPNELLLSEFLLLPEVSETGAEGGVEGALAHPLVSSLPAGRSGRAMRPSSTPA